MDIFSELKIGDKLSLEIIEEFFNKDTNNMLSTQLMDIDDKFLYIAPPSYKGKKYSLSKSQKINLFFYRKEGVYQFEAQVVGKIDTNIITFALKPTGNIVKIQRRNYYRLPVAVPVILRKQSNSEGIQYERISKDLSGGGVKLICKYEIDMSEKVVVDIQIEENQVVTLYGDIVRVINDSENNTYELGVEFKSTNEPGVDRIFAFIFEIGRASCRERVL